MYKSETFERIEQLVYFLNENNIKKENIISITSVTDAELWSKHFLVYQE